jgi:DNA uptake protein ComE-like DNA-binding protein
MRGPGERSVQRGAIAAALGALGLMVAEGLSFAADPGPSSAPPPAATAGTTSKKATSPAAALVDINSASLAQLKTLPGIGEAEAARIVAGRPYLSKADLAVKEVIPTGIYVSLKDRIIAIQKQQPKAKY